MAINFLVQDAPWMPAGNRFRIVKTQLDVSFDGCIVETDVGLAKPFETEYFPSRKAANERRKELVTASDEIVLGVHDFIYVTNAEVAEWLYDTGRLIGIENFEAWFDCQSKVDQSRYKIEFKEVQAAAALKANKPQGASQLGM